MPGCALGAISPQTSPEPIGTPRLHFFNLLSGGHSSLEPRLPIPNRTVKRVCADDSVPFAHAKVGYRQAIFRQGSPISKEVGLFCWRLGAVNFASPLRSRAATAAG